MCKFLKTPSPRPLLLFISIASAAILSVALIAQYGFDLHPCELCLYQRYPYAALIVLGLAGRYFAKSNRMLCYSIFACALLFLTDAGIAGYHAGVEMNIFPGPTACSSSAKPNQTIEEMLEEIKNAPLVPCNQAMAHFFGLSMAAWNAIAAALLAVFTLVMLRKIAKKPAA